MNKYLIIAVYALFVSLYGNAATAAVASVAENPFMHQESQDHPNSSLGIHNGDEVPSFSSVPFMARVTLDVGNSTKGGCGASFIRKDLVITAAHCLVKNERMIDAKYVEISYGGVNLKNKKSFIKSKIQGYKIYPYYVTKNVNKGVVGSGDVAIIKLIKDADPKVKPLKIMDPLDAEYYLQEGAPVDTYGWGFTSYGKKAKGSDKLLHIKIDIGSIFDIKKTLMASGYSPNQFDLFKMIGTLSITGKVIDHGDSGGPLLAPCSNIICLVGVASHAIDEGVLSLFANVTHYMNNSIYEWVEAQINTY